MALTRLQINILNAVELTVLSYYKASRTELFVSYERKYVQIRRMLFYFLNDSGITPREVAEFYNQKGFDRTTIYYHLKAVTEAIKAKRYSDYFHSFELAPRVLTAKQRIENELC